MQLNLQLKLLAIKIKVTVKGLIVVMMTNSLLLSNLRYICLCYPVVPYN